MPSFTIHTQKLFIKRNNSAMYISVIIVILNLCYSCSDFQNYRGVSENIEDSKRRGVYICGYEGRPNPIRINDSLIFDIKEAWLERQWKYPENYKNTEPIEGYQLMVLINNEIYKDISRNWSIGVDFERYIRPCGKNCLITDFPKLPISNKEIWQIQAGRYLNAESKKVILGEFILYRKN